VEFCNLSVYLGSRVAMSMTLVVQVSTTSDIIREILCLYICSAEGSVAKTMYEDCAEPF